jgi:hypothetical protein
MAQGSPRGQPRPHRPPPHRHRRGRPTQPRPVHGGHARRVAHPGANASAVPVGGPPRDDGPDSPRRRRRGPPPLAHRATDPSRQPRTRPARPRHDHPDPANPIRVWPDPLQNPANGQLAAMESTRREFAATCGLLFSGRQPPTPWSMPPSATPTTPGPTPTEAPPATTTSPPLRPVQPRQGSARLAPPRHGGPPHGPLTPTGHTYTHGLSTRHVPRSRWGGARPSTQRQGRGVPRRRRRHPYMNHSANCGRADPRNGTAA